MKKLRVGLIGCGYTHLAFYAGWPSAVTAIAVAKDVFQQQGP